MATTKEGEQLIAELLLIDHRHGEQREFILKLTPTHLILQSADPDHATNKQRSGFGAKLRQMFGAKGPMTPHPLLDTDLRLDNSAVRIRMGTNAAYSYSDFNPIEARKFLVAYLQAKGTLMKKP